MEPHVDDIYEKILEDDEDGGNFVNCTNVDDSAEGGGETVSEGSTASDIEERSDIDWQRICM